MAEILDAHADFEKRVEIMRRENAAQAAMWRENAMQAGKASMDRGNYLAALDKARIARRRTAWLDSWLAAIRSGSPVPAAPRALFEPEEIKYLSAAGVPIEAIK